MDKQRALKLLSHQFSELKSLHYKKGDFGFEKWRRDTRVVLENIFGADSSHVKEFGKIHFAPRRVVSNEMEQLQYNAEGFDEGKSKADSFLRSVISELEKFGEDSEEAPASSANVLATVLKLCARFHSVSRQLRVRHEGRNTLEVEDEYDVQDLLHALLKIDFDDIRPEEWTPSYAGKCARMDFLLKDCQIVIEAKKTGKALGEKQVGDELLVDIARYKEHLDCKTLVCFVYDPEERISNPKGLENDLSREKDGLKVLVIVNPK